MDQKPLETPRRVTLITNKAANRGRAEKTGKKVEELLRSYNHDVEHHLPTNALQAASIAQDAIGDRRHLIAVGGDGLVHSLIQVCAETDSTLGVIPAGTGNDLVFGLDLPVALRTSVDAALKPAKEIDVLKFESDHGQPKYGATIATAGFSAAVNVRAEIMSWPRGASRYTVATLRELADLKRYDFELTIDGAEIDGRCLMVAIANTRAFGGGMQIAPEADPADGLADVVIIRDSSALTLLRMLPKAFSGGHLSHPAVETFRGNDAVLSMKDSDSANTCSLRTDGEDVGSLPQTVTVVRGGLRVAGVRPSAPDTDEGKENS